MKIWFVQLLSTALFQAVVKPGLYLFIFEIYVLLNCILVLPTQDISYIENP
jgi:hypothetical protein